jgi:hypothetical protein
MLHRAGYLLNVVSTNKKGKPVVLAFLLGSYQSLDPGNKWWDEGPVPVSLRCFLAF